LGCRLDLSLDVDLAICRVARTLKKASSFPRHEHDGVFAGEGVSPLLEEMLSLIINYELDGIGIRFKSKLLCYET
jgi:hypothetical protein